MIATRLRQLGMLLFSMLLCAVAFFQMFERTTNGFPQNYVWMLAFVSALFLTAWGLLLRFQPHADQSVMCCVLVLTGIGVTMIARLDQDTKTTVAFRQLLWLAIALVFANLLVVFMRDYRVLRRFSYVSMVIGIVLLLSPMLPVVGSEQYGARIWVKIPGLGSFQPSEFAKLFLAFFFASYLFDHRDQLAVGGKKILGIQLPRIKDMGPIIVVWIVSMGVLVLQHDLGTSLMFFAMFVSMLYVATGRKSWIVIGFIAFAAGAVAAASIFSHVGSRVDAWLHPFSAAQYNKEYGGSYQLVTGIFGLASGGLMGTGLGQGHPSITPIANSDYIYAALGEELGLTGLMAILMLYLLIIAAGMITAMKIKDGFGKLLASGLVFTMAFQVFTVVGGITLVIPADRSDASLHGGRRFVADRKLHAGRAADRHLQFREQAGIRDRQRHIPAGSRQGVARTRAEPSYRNRRQYAFGCGKGFGHPGRAGKPCGRSRASRSCRARQSNQPSRPDRSIQSDDSDNRSPADDRPARSIA